MSVQYNDGVSKVNKQPGMHTFSQIDAVTIKNSMTENVHWINDAGWAFILTQYSVVYGEHEYMVNQVTCLFSLFWST